MFNNYVKMAAIGSAIVLLCGCSLFSSGTGTATPSASPASPSPAVTATPPATATPSAEPPVTSKPATPDAAKSPAPSSPTAKPPAKQTALEFAGQVAAALQAKDLNKLANMVDPNAGVRFSPYAHIDLKKDIVLKPDALRKMSFTSMTTSTWGTFDGSGEEMKLTFAEYYKKFVYDRDFVKIGKPSENKTIKTGNTAFNFSESYPKATFVEYHDPGTASSGGMDWSSLRIVIKQDSAGAWRLIGIVHDQWTI